MSSSSKQGFIAVCSTLLGLSTIAVGLRLIARRKQHLPIKADDVFAIVALLSYLGAIICEFQLVHMRKLGYSYQDLSHSKTNARTTVNLALAWDVLAVMCSASIKLSALFFYRRLFTVKGMRKPFDMVSMGTIILVSVWVFAYTLMPFFQCGTYFSVLWKGGSAKYCTEQEPYYMSLVISNFILDLWILLLPIPSILRLHTSTSKKISLIGVFLLAFVGLGASIARMVTYIQILTIFKKHPVQHDLGLAQTRAAYLTHLEAGISLVAVNLPSLWLLVTKVVPETALRSIRSALSLSSIRSSKLSDGGRNNNNNNANGGVRVDSPSITKKTTSVVMSHPNESTAALHPVHGDVEAYRAEVYAGGEKEEDHDEARRSDSLHA